MGDSGSRGERSLNLGAVQVILKLPSLASVDLPNRRQPRPSGAISVSRSLDDGTDRLSQLLGRQLHMVGHHQQAASLVWLSRLARLPHQVRLQDMVHVQI